MSEKLDGYSERSVEGLILVLRGQRVILDSDLARIYGVQTKRLNEQVRRNKSRFPSDFVFQLTVQEISNLKSQIATSSLGFGQGHGGVRKSPWAFNEHGALMAATVLNSPKAVEMSLFIVRAFVKMRERLAMTQALEKHLAEIDRKLMGHDAALRDIYERIRPLLLPPVDPPKRKIGFRADEKRALYGFSPLKFRKATAKEHEGIMEKVKLLKQGKLKEVQVHPVVRMK